MPASAAAMPLATPASIPVVETFHSLQGEGLHAGRSAFFLRLAGCSVGCPWCDTKHSWPPEAHPHRELQELAAEARAAAATGAAFVVVTGGEPLHHNLDGLCAALTSAGVPLHLETSGVDGLSGRFDWITLSPKRHRPPRPELLTRCDELKVVIHEPADLRFAEAMAAQMRIARAAAGSTNRAGAGDDSDQPHLLLQPGWESEAGLQLAVAHVRRHPRWRLSLQSHKWLGVR
jgi:organic radical activating enzyme